MTALVIGAGYIGSALTRLLLARGERVVTLDNCFSAEETTIAGLGQGYPAEAYSFFRGSISEPRDVRRAISAANRPSIVFCLAAQASARADAATPEYTEETNLRGPRLVLDALGQQRQPGASLTIVYASSTRVYGDSLTGGRLPDARTAPYGRFSDLAHLSKIYTEKLHEMYAAPAGPLAGARIVAARLGLVYGVAPVMKTDYRFMTAPNKFCLQAIRGEEIAVWGQQDVALVHVADAARALMALASASGEGYAPVNIAAEVVSVARIAREVGAAAAARGRAVRLSIPDETPAADESWASESRLEDTSPDELATGWVASDLGGAPELDLRRGIAEVLDYFGC